MRAIIFGTGPSVTMNQLWQIRDSGLPVFGCNNTYKYVPLTAHYACNDSWWHHYMKSDGLLRYSSFDKWTHIKAIADEYGIMHCPGKWGPGLAPRDADYIHFGHGSGFETLGVAHKYGVTEALLVGYDLRYPPGYDGHKRQTGNGLRRFFGEYPKSMEHWTKFNIGENGELNGLLDMYRAIDTTASGIRIINCSPGSALDFFEVGDLGDFI